MDIFLKKISNIYRHFCLQAYKRLFELISCFGNAMMFVFGLCLLCAGIDFPALAIDLSDFELSGNVSVHMPGYLYDDGLVRDAGCNLFQLIEGDFGGLIMTISGVTAVIAASAGKYGLSYGLLLTGVGAFILRSLVTLFFGGFCGAGETL